MRNFFEKSASYWSMRNKYVKNRVLALAAVLFLSACGRSDPGTGPVSIEYPETATIEHVDDYHGVEVADP